MDDEIYVPGFSGNRITTAGKSDEQVICRSMCLCLIGEACPSRRARSVSSAYKPTYITSTRSHAALAKRKETNSAPTLSCAHHSARRSTTAVLLGQPLRPRDPACEQDQKMGRYTNVHISRVRRSTPQLPTCPVHHTTAASNHRSAVKPTTSSPETGT